MSYQGSPYSFHIQDDYDIDDDAYDDLDDYRDQDDPHPPALDDSDEDTEEASETDMGNNDEPLEMKEQMYQDKLASLRKQLQQLRDGAHPEYARRVRRLEQQLGERQRLNSIQRDYLLECVEQDYILEKKAAAKEFEEKKVDLKENLLTDFEDKRKHIENDRHSMELNGDSMEVKPAMTRKLRRRPNEPAPVPDKRRKPPATTLTYVLDDRDIEADLRAIARGRPLPPAQARKMHQAPHSPLTHSIGKFFSPLLYTPRKPSPLPSVRSTCGRRKAAVREALVPPRPEHLRGGPRPSPLPRTHHRYRIRLYICEEGIFRRQLQVEDLHLAIGPRKNIHQKKSIISQSPALLPLYITYPLIGLPDDKILKEHALKMKYKRRTLKLKNFNSNLLK